MPCRMREPLLETCAGCSGLRQSRCSWITYQATWTISCAPASTAGTGRPDFRIEHGRGHVSGAQFAAPVPAIVPDSVRTRTPSPRKNVLFSHIEEVGEAAQQIAKIARAADLRQIRVEHCPGTLGPVRQRWISQVIEQPWWQDKAAAAVPAR
jgi:hypothetical protein